MSIYVGPYLYCTVDQVKTRIEITSCSSEICHLLKEREKFDEGQKYCTECGSAAAKVMVDGAEADSVGRWALNEATKERLCMFDDGEFNSPEVHIHIPNQDWSRQFDKSHPTHELRVRAVMIEQEMEWFRIVFKPGIDLAMVLYGADRTEIRWGVLGYY